MLMLKFCHLPHEYDFLEYFFGVIIRGFFLGGVGNRAFGVNNVKERILIKQVSSWEAHCCVAGFVMASTPSTLRVLDSTCGKTINALMGVEAFTIQIPKLLKIQISVSKKCESRARVPNSLARLEAKIPSSSGLA